MTTRHASPRIRRYVRVAVRMSVIAIIVVSAYVYISALNLERRLVDGAIESWTEKPFYESTDPVSTIPGALIRSERLASAPDGMIGWRIVYQSTDQNGRVIVTSGLVAAPSANTQVKRTVIAWGHPTTGITERCAPSVGIDLFDMIEGLRAIVDAGYTVVAPDYSGMGMSGPPSFLIGEVEGRNMLDAVRAAQQLDAAHAGNEVITWGHSQGGHAALFAAQIARSYAPELTVKGVATAAPATELGALLHNNIGDVSGVTIGAYAFSSYARAYGVGLETILTPTGVSATSEMATLCLIGQNSELHTIARPLVGNYILSDPASTEPWSGLLLQNTPGQEKLPVPLFIAQGQKDTLIQPAISAAFAEKQKSLGANVMFVPIPGATHGTIALDAIPSLMSWLETVR